MSIKMIQSLIDNIPLKPSVRTTTATTAKMFEPLLLCEDSISRLQDYQRLAEDYYSEFLVFVVAEERRLSELSSGDPETEDPTYQYMLAKLNTSKAFGVKLKDEIAKVNDFTDLEYTKMMYAITRDYGSLTANVRDLEKKYKEIEQEVAKIKKSTQKDSTAVTISNTQVSKEKVDIVRLSSILYEMELYMITPTSEKIELHQYVGEFLYTREFDVMNLPIYSVNLKVPHNVLMPLKDHYEHNRWFITFKKHKRTQGNNNDFTLPEVIFNDLEVVAVDPEFGPPKQESSDRPEKSAPIYPLRVDLVPKKDTKLNAAVKTRIFNNVTLLDVILVLCDELKVEYAKLYPDTSKDVKFVVTPPDNTTTYEQILVEPGTFTDVIYRLQEKYGVYMTGIRVSYDSVQTISNPDGSTTAVTTISIIDKGGIAPTEDSITDVVIELVDPNMVDSPVYESGFNVNPITSTILIRSSVPYQVIRNNSEALVSGESVRVMQSSSDDHVVTACDESATSDINSSRMYWNKYDNAYTMTQLQDSIKEKNLIILVELRDVDALSLGDNLSYRLKFFGQDDKLYSGDYRLMATRMYHRNKSLSDGSRIEPVAVLTFTDMSAMKIAGMNVERATYGERLSNSVASKGDGAGYIETGANYTPGPVRSGKGAPFPSNFAGKTDYYGVVVPDSIPDDFKMSDTVTFSDVYVTKDGVDPRKANSIANSFPHFVNAQRYSKEVLDVLNSMFPKNGVGRLNSFYRYSVPDGGSKTSHHLIAIASDAMWGGIPGDPLADAFYKIMKSNIEFDQIILEGNGSQWRWIHVGKQLNGANRRQIKVAPNVESGGYKTVAINRVSSGSDLYYKNYRKAIY